MHLGQDSHEEWAKAHSYIDTQKNVGVPTPRLREGTREMAVVWSPETIFPRLKPITTVASPKIIPE